MSSNGKICENVAFRRIGRKGYRISMFGERLIYESTGTPEFSPAFFHFRRSEKANKFRQKMT